MTTSLPSGRYAPLYHVMDVHKAVAVFTGDAMPARFTHFDVVGRRMVSGNSFSRNPGMAVRATDCIRITVDQDALRNRHRLIPFDADAAYERYCRFMDDDGNMNWEEFEDYWDAHDYDPRETDRRKSRWGQQWSEEFVLGDIRELHRYVTRIEVNYQDHPRWHAAQSAANTFADRFGIEIEMDAVPAPARPIPQVAQVALIPLKPIPLFDFPDIPYIPDLASRR